MPAARLRDVHLRILAPTLVVLGAVASVIAFKQVESTRHELVQTRLRTAVGIAHDRAAAALVSPEARVVFFEELRNWSRVTGLRLTLILPDGSVLADTEVAQMPNLADRPEVRAAQQGRTEGAFRRSVMTGKETLYIATPIASGGKVVGTLRASTSTEEIDEVLAGFEYVFMIIAGCCIGAGVLAGLVLGLTARRSEVDVEPPALEAPGADARPAAIVSAPPGLVIVGEASGQRESKSAELTSIAD